MRTAARALKVGDVREKLHAIQSAQDALDAAKSVLLAELEATKDFELDGASTLNMWVRTQLRVNPGEATTLVRNIAALRDLPAVGEAATAGEISAAHVKVFTYGLRHVGLEPMRQFEDVFLGVARECAPHELFEAVKHLKDVTHPEELDAAWERGMDREDLCVDAVPDGWHVNGFLDTITGAKLKTVLDSVSAPRDAEDTRTGSERRVQGLDDLLTGVLGNGLPSEKGVRPHVSVFVESTTPAEPATLAGYGAIGPNLLNYFLCVSDTTPISILHCRSTSATNSRSCRGYSGPECPTAVRVSLNPVGVLGVCGSRHCRRDRACHNWRMGRRDNFRLGDRASFRLSRAA